MLATSRPERRVRLPIHKKRATKRFRLQTEGVTEWAVAIAAGLGVVKLLPPFIRLLRT
ncbi:hypothetical protein GCM10025871_09290 [Deinococcus metallilatus]|nr:hypothetical protein GCM10025871_09290 [Deinococcus metallilatus]